MNSDCQVLLSAFFPLLSLHLVFWQREVTREPWPRLERRCFWPVISVSLPQAYWDALMRKHFDTNSHGCVLMCPQMHTDSDIPKCMHGHAYVGREVVQPTCTHLHILNITECAQVCVHPDTPIHSRVWIGWSSCICRVPEAGQCSTHVYLSILWGLDVRSHHAFSFCAPQRTPF